MNYVRLKTRENKKVKLQRYEEVFLPFPRSSFAKMFLSVKPGND